MQTFAFIRIVFMKRPQPKAPARQNDPTDNVGIYMKGVVVTHKRKGLWQWGEGGGILSFRHLLV
jgi:hypothetical protein